MTAAQTPQRQPCTLEGAMTFQRFEGVGGAGWLEPASMADPWAENEPVKSYWQGKYQGKRRHLAFP